MAASVKTGSDSSPRFTSRIVKIGLAASSAATAALFLTYCTGNRDVGFGKSISETQQTVMLIVAGFLFAVFGAVHILARLRADRPNRVIASVQDWKESGNDEI